MVGGNGTISQSCQQYVTLEHDTCLQFVLGWGHPTFVIFPPWVWVIHFYLSFSLCLITMTSHPLISNTAKFRSYVTNMFKRSSFCSFQPLILCLVLIHYDIIPLSCVDGVGNIMALLRLINSCRLELIIQEADLETPFRYLGTCMPQWQVLRIRRKVFIIDLRSDDFVSVRRQLTVHSPWIVPHVPRGPSSLLVVSLMSVNYFHYWLVIRRCSCMFDFSSLIHMLRLVLCSGQYGAQEPGFCMMKFRLQILCGLS